MKRTITMLLIAALVFTGCGDANEPSVEEQSLHSKDGRHTITIPGGWKNEEDRLNPGAVLAASNRGEEQYVIVLPDNRENLAVIYPDFDLQQYSAYVVQTMSEKMGEPVVGEPEAIEVGGRPAVLTEFSGEMKNTQITYWVACVEVEELYIQLIGWTASENAQSSREIIGDILSSYTHSQIATSSSSASTELLVQKV